MKRSQRKEALKLPSVDTVVNGVSVDAVWESLKSVPPWETAMFPSVTHCDSNDSDYLRTQTSRDNFNGPFSRVTVSRFKTVLLNLSQQNGHSNGFALKRVI